jgi:head-tail adaptor
MIRPRLRRRLVLEGVSEVADGLGGLVRSWVVLGTHWAEVTPSAGREAEGEAFPLSSVPLRITVRGTAVGTPSRPVAGQRFRDGTRVYAILAVTERDPDGRYLVCAAREEEPA